VGPRAGLDVVQGFSDVEVYCNLKKNDRTCWMGAQTIVRPLPA